MISALPFFKGKMLQNRSVCHCRNTLISFPVNELGGMFIFLHIISDIALSYEAAANVPATPGVPEPATATLSLLALCGLAARRRRH